MAKSTFKVQGAIEVGSLASAPANPKPGTIYYDTSQSKTFIYDGSSFQEVTDESKIGDLAYGPSNYTPTDATNVSGHLEGIDSALASAGSDENVKVSANDTTAGYLEAKIVASEGSNTTNILEVTTLNDGADEDLQLQIDQSKIDHGALEGLADDDHTQYTRADGTRAFTGDQSMGSNKLTSLANGTLAADAVNKSQLDTKPDSNLTVLRDGSQDFTGNQSMGANKLIDLADGTNSNDAVNKSQLDVKSDSADVVLRDGSQAFTGAQSMGSNKLTSLADGTLANDAVNKSQLDTKADDADVIKKDGSVAFTASQSMGGFALTSVLDPTSAQDAATKAYVDAVAEGLKPKEAVKAASTANLTLSGAQTVDGISLTAGDRILVKDQTTASENGIYDVAAGAWTRSTDFDSLSPIDEINGAMVAVQEGTANEGKIFVQQGSVSTIDTDDITFVFYNSSSSLVGGDGITVSGSNISVDHDGEGLTFSATQLALELDGSTLSKSATGVKVADSGITDTQVASGINATKIGGGAVDNTEFSYLDGVTSAIQTQLDSKAADADVIKKDGSVAFTADQAMGSNKITGLADGTLAGDAVNKSQLDTKAADADVIKKDGSVAFTGDQAMGSNKITGLADGTAAGDAVNKSQLDTKIGNVSEDTTPELGGNLDVAGFAIEDDTADLTLAGQDSIRRAKQASKSNYIEEEYVHSVSLLASQTDTATGLSFATATYQAQEISYVLEDSSNNKRLGTLRVINDGTNVNINDVGTELGDASAITFDADINTGNVRILYSTGANTATVRFDIKKFLV